MRYYKNRPILAQGYQCILDTFFRNGIESRRCLVQNYKWRVLQQTAGNGNLLGRTAGGRFSCKMMFIVYQKGIRRSFGNRKDGVMIRVRVRVKIGVQTRCFSPPDNFKPLSPTTVFNPSGSPWMKSRICADRHTCSTSAKEASNFP
jgi:hypothetical protein